MMFWILIAVVIVAGLSQGLLLPLLTIWLEQRGISAELNAMNAAALYIGTFAAMFFVEKPVRRFGYKPVIVAGMIVVITSTLMFSVTDSLIIWFALRLLVGVGDSFLHYASQVWLVSSSPPERRGRNISLYGMAYGIGFSLGPLAIRLVKFGDWVPFMVVNIFFVLVLLTVFRLRNEHPELADNGPSASKRYAFVYRLAWFPLLPSFLYGYMEASMNANFPVYGLRSGLSTGDISLLLPWIGVGSLVLQLPLGIWSDKVGRKPILIGAGIVGAAAFLAVPLAGSNGWLIGLLFAVAGGAVGSFYSLGLAYAADLLTRPMLPTANVLASIHYSIASLIGPSIGGLMLQRVALPALFFLLGGAYLVFALIGFRFQAKSSHLGER